MQTFIEPGIIAANVLRDGVLVTFNDRRPEFYLASALHQMPMLAKWKSAAEDPLEIVSIDRTPDGSLIVEFSDGTTANYRAEDLIKLRPDRIKPYNDQIP